MRAVVYDSPRSSEVVEVPTPTFGPDEVLVRVVAAGVCGTDAHLHEGEFDPVYPLTPGHEAMGEVIEVGSSVTSPRVTRCQPHCNRHTSRREVEGGTEFWSYGGLAMQQGPYRGRNPVQRTRIQLIRPSLEV
jgi:threonine dehydrogenase-like Zn-dependent dehydrogenase